jgi:hypothetical protein
MTIACLARCDFFIPPLSKFSTVLFTQRHLSGSGLCKPYDFRSCEVAPAWVLTYF